MPYPGIADELTGKMEECVTKVMAQGHDKDSAIAICTASLTGKRDISFNGIELIVRHSWDEQYGQAYPDVWIQQVFATYVIAELRGRLLQIGYMFNGISAVFANEDTWEIVEAQYVPSFAPTMVRTAQPVRMMGSDGNNLYRCYGVLFGTPEDKDLYGTYFTRDTNYYLDWYTNRPWLYHHTMNPAFAEMRDFKIGQWIDVDMDDTGVFFIGELDASHRYWEAVKQLIAEGVLYPSTGTLSYVARIAEDGHVEDWPIVEVSSTPQPGEWRMGSYPISSEAQRALQTLGGFDMGLKDKLTGLFSRAVEEEEKKKPAEEEEGTMEAGKQEEAPEKPMEKKEEDEQRAEKQPESEAEAPTTPTPETTQNEAPVDEGASVAEITEAIFALDKALAGLTAKVTELEQRLAAANVSRAVAVEEAVKGHALFKDLFVVTRQGEQATEEEVKAALSAEDARAVANMDKPQSMFERFVH